MPTLEQDGAMIRGSELMSTAKILETILCLLILTLFSLSIHSNRAAWSAEKSPKVSPVRIAVVSRSTLAPD